MAACCIFHLTATKGGDVRSSDPPPVDVSGYLQCGGPECSTSSLSKGLDNHDCCVNTIIANGVECGGDVVAPCISYGEFVKNSVAEVFCRTPHETIGNALLLEHQ